MGKDEHRNENRDDAREEKPSGSSRLGKEAKIGVTVIAVLAVALGVAAAMRWGPSSEDEKQAAADRDVGKDKLSGPSKPDPLFNDSRSKMFGGSSPTVVSATAAPSRPPRSTAGDSWKTASNRSESKRLGSGTTSSPSPSFMPDPPKPTREDRHNRFALDPPAMKEVDDLKAPRRPDNDARIGLPDEQPRRHSKARSDRSDASGFASTSDMPPAPPPMREGSRYDISQPPSGSLRGSSSYSVGVERSTPAMTVGQYDADEFRRDPPEPRRHNSGLRRSTAASSFSNPPPRRDDGKYEVQPNDSYWTISEKLYNSGAYFKALAQHNRGKDAEDRLQPGALIMAPTVAELEKSYPDLCPKPSRREAVQSQAQNRASTVSTRGQYRGGRTYTVVEGDTLFNIARYELGKASRWAEIYDLNREMLGKDFNYLTPGTQLSMPEGEKSDVIAQPLGSGYRR